MDPAKIEAIYRLGQGEGWSIRKIARHLKVSRRSVKKYLENPAAIPARRRRTSRLDPYQETIGELLEKDAEASAVVIAQRLVPLGYRGGLTILRAYLRKVRPRLRPVRAYVRVESAPGERFEVDWGHFGVLDYEGDPRKLYAFALIDCHSRRLYLEFTHSQCFETFVRCHVHAFRFMTGVGREILYDNLATSVLEHDGNLVCFHPRFLAFARQYHFFPRACHQGAAWEKGKIERGGIRYIRQNFWPLRTFADLADVNRQARLWREEVANCRVHSETQERPEERFRPQALQPLPMQDPDYRETASPRVHTDLRLRFDANRYCVPARFVGLRLTVKADSSSVTIYYENREIVRYPRCWRRHQTLGAERFEKELLDQRPTARRSRAQSRLVALLGEVAESYLRGLADTDRALARQVTELLELVRLYGPEAVASALEKAARQGAYGAEYVANLLHQERTPRELQPPVPLKDPALQELAPDPLSLLEYDALILTQRREP